MGCDGALRRAAAALALSLGAAVAPAAEVTRQQVLLLQPDDELRFRVQSEEAYGDYIAALRAVLFAQLQAHTLAKPTAGFFVLAVRPGQQARVWLDFQPPLGPGLSLAIRQHSLRLLPPLVREGPVLLSLKLSLDGAPWPVQAAPQPAAWQLAALLAGEPMNFSALIDRVWDWPSP